MNAEGRTTWRGIALAVLLAAAAGLPAAAQVRVQAELPEAGTAGRTETLTVRLVDAEGRPVPAPRDLVVTVLVEGADIRIQRKLDAGVAELPLTIRSGEAAAHTVEVVVEGLEPVWLPWIVLRAEGAAQPSSRAADGSAEAEGEAAEGEAAAGTSPPPEAAPAAAVRELRQVTAVPTASPSPPLEPPARRLPGLAPTMAQPFPAGAADEESGGEAHTMARVSRDSREAGASSMRSDGLPPAAAQTERTLRLPPATASERGAPGAAADGATEAPPPAADGGIVANRADRPPAGRLRFEPSQLSVQPASDGRYRRPIQATWYVGDFPARAESDVEAELRLVEQPEGLVIAPDRLRIAASAMTGSVLLEASQRGRARLQALLPGHEVADLVVDLLPARPVRAVFAADQTVSIRRLGPAELTVRAGLVDGDGRPTVAPAATTLRFVARGGAGEIPCEAIVPAGEREGRCLLAISHFGLYDLTVTMLGGDLEIGKASFELAFDRALLGWALLGGLVGAVIQGARRRVKSNEPLARTYLLGVTAALVVVLLLVFGGLVWLDVAFPQGLREAAERSSQPALFLLGLLAGFGSEAVFAALDRHFSTIRAARRSGSPAGGGPAAGGGVPPGQGPGDGETLPGSGGPGNGEAAPAPAGGG